MIATLALFSSLALDMTVQRFLSDVKDGQPYNVDELTTPSAYYHSFFGLRREAGPAAGADYQRFAAFARKHRVIRTKTDASRVTLFWNCKQIDPPACFTEFDFEDGKISSINHFADVRVSFDG